MLCRPGAGRHSTWVVESPRTEPRRVVPCQALWSKASSTRASRTCTAGGSGPSRNTSPGRRPIDQRARRAGRRPGAAGNGSGTTGARRRGLGGRARDGRFLGHFLLRPEDAAPILVLCDRHAALDTDANALGGLSLAGEQLLQNAHVSSSGWAEPGRWPPGPTDRSICGETEKPVSRFARILKERRTVPVCSGLGIDVVESRHPP